MHALPKKLLLTIVLIITVSGCTLKFTYNQLDWLIPWYLNDYITLNDEQYPLLNRQLEQYLFWHRQEALPEYSEFVANLKAASQSHWNATKLVMRPFSETTLLSFETQINQLFKTTLKPAVMPAVKLAMQLDKNQWQEIREEFNDKNRDYYQDYIDQNETDLRQDRAESVEKLFEHFLGELNPQQVKAITVWQQQFHIMHREILNTRKAWQASLLKTIQPSKQSDKQSLQKQLQVLFLQRELWHTDKFTELFTQNRQHAFALIQAIQTNLSSAQYQHLQERLEDYQNDFQSLSNDS